MAANNSDLPRICVLGSLNIDLVSYVPHHPAPGETLTSNSFHVSPGGKVSVPAKRPSSLPTLTCPFLINTAPAHDTYFACPSYLTMN